jgi:hypothetical protein
MAADALVVVGGDVAAGHGLCLLDLVHRGLRAIHDAVVALEAQAAAHAALGLADRLLFGQGFQALFEVAQRAVLVEVGDVALVAFRVLEVAEEELVVGMT